MPRERPHVALNPVEAACERLKRERERTEGRVRSLNPDRDLTWESTEDDTFRSMNFDENYYD